MTIIKQFENVRYVINSILLQNNLLAIQRKIEEKNHVLLIVPLECNCSTWSKMAIQIGCLYPALPLIMPLGMIAPEETFAESSATGFYSDDEREKVSVNLEKVILNEFVDVKLDDLMNGENIKDQDPEEVVRTFLGKLIEELKYSNHGDHIIRSTKCFSLNSSRKIQLLLKETAVFMDLDILKLKTVEQTTCFMINLANLMWIHASFSGDSEIQNGLLFRNWALRHIIFNSVGYNIGQLGFVSLYDLHSSLFNFPPIFRTTTLSSLMYSNDARVHFLIAQPYVLSPKITVVHPVSLELQMEESWKIYFEKFVIIKDMTLIITVPFLLYMERISYDQNMELEMINNSNGISEKLNWFIEILKEKNFPYEKLLARDVYMLNDTQFRINFSYSAYDIQNVPVHNKIIWRICLSHRSLYHCLVHHTSVVRSTMLEDHYSEFLCRDSNKSSDQICLNNTLFKISKIFNPLFRELQTHADYSNKGQRCLYTVLSFVIGGTSYSDRTFDFISLQEFSNILKIVKTVFLNIQTVDICRKIQLCVKIIVNENDIHQTWPKWFNLFFADPSKVLKDLVERGNASLACEWVVVQSTFDSAYIFSAEAYSNLIALLCGFEDISFLRKAIEYMHAIPMDDVINNLIKSKCSASKLISLVLTVISMDCLTETEEIKFYSLLTGLKMTNLIPRNEQVYYYEIAHSPLLIVEQLILNKKIGLLKTILKEVTPFIRSLSETLQKAPCLSINEIDEQLKVYAEKALYFRRKVSPINCKNAAMIHAFIIKDDDEYFPPDIVPKETDWIPNNWAVVCLYCEKQFSIFNRRHHCRRCGRVVCNSCSKKKMHVNTYKLPQRVCDQCFKFEKQYELVDDNSCTSSSTIGERTKPVVWILNMDKETNERTRRQAIFDSAPDVELCFSLLELHTENVSVPRFLCMKGKEMISILRNRFTSPSNFDYPEVTFIIRSLLLAAKMYYTHLGELQGARSCEELTSEVDILNQLTNQKFVPPMSNKSIRNIEDWTKMRQALLENQNWELALEVSLKNGLECYSIWYLWGIELLKSQKWADARQKFARSNLKRKHAKLNYVLDIMYAKMENKESPKKLGIFYHSKNKKTPLLPDKLYEESLFYLKSYGTSEQLFTFYVNQDRISEATRLAYVAKISPKSFLTLIYLPALEMKEQEKIMKYMEAVDATLTGWKKFIKVICAYFSSNKHFDPLYEIQIWMKDYYRAAISSTVFYRRNAKSYADLAKNKKYLYSAISNFQMAIDQFTKAEKNEILENVKPEDISKHSETVNLQMKVMKMVCSNVECANLQFDNVPTLFGRNSEKLDLIVLIFDATTDTKSAFNLSNSILTQYSVNTDLIYGELADRLIKKNRENDVIDLIKYINASVPEPHSIVNYVARVTIKANPKDLDVFIDSITDEVLKCETYIETDSLKSAYMLAMKLDRRDLIEKVLAEARRLNRPSIEKVCIMLLKTRGSIAGSS